MTKLDWERAKRGSSRPAALMRHKAELSTSRSRAMYAYVEKHSLACFKCSTEQGPWAKTGHSRYGPWALCKNCARNKR